MSQVPIELGVAAFAIGSLCLLIKEILKFISSQRKDYLDRFKDVEDNQERMFSEFVKMSAKYTETINNHLRHEEDAHKDQTRSNKALKQTIQELIVFLKNSNGKK